MIKILDCTLRDGGYINNWVFGAKSIKQIISNLTNAGLDYVECGFLKQLAYKKDLSLFSDIEKLKNFLPNNENSSFYTLMINYGEYDIENLPSSSYQNIVLRIVFKKNDYKQALEYCNKLKKRGYEIFINPMHTSTYSEDEMLDLINKTNKIKPKALTIVDTTGSMKENDTTRLFSLIDKNLNKDVAVCFHSHNNLQLSFSNAQLLMKNCKNRELIIDSTVFGMGRGAGNLCTELITQYINDNYGGNYNLIPILKLIDEQINPIFEKTPWGYSVPYYLSAINFAHPNYAKYLIDKQTVPVEIIDKLLKNIPQNKRSGYDEGLIKQIYLDNFSNSIDDSSTLKFLNKVVNNKNILILASGKTLKTEKKKINDFIEKNNPFVVSLNFIPENFDSDLVFITNIKRYMTLPENKKTIIMTSNISEARNEKKVLNYSKYLNNSKLYDNIALMFLKVLINIGIKKAYFAGLDGFEFINSKNYSDEKLLMTTKIDDYIERNTIMSEQLSKFNKGIEINFVTTTKYKINTEQI